MLRGSFHHLRPGCAGRYHDRRVDERGRELAEPEGQIRAQWLHHERNRRQILYRDFIDEASKCYIDALQHDEADISSLVGLYAKLSRMRVSSSEPVVHRAEDIARKILDTYLEPDRSFVELRDMAINGSIDLLHEFSNACRDEFEQLRARQF